ncbi:MAG: nitrogen regulation protein NR(II) [Proteobacteria bacterium]|jgi:two-component system nitrogen regulation sensor histidine kinase GlnL|nr:nitrogen regulation protein NR(II) [Pseudomonadota bacterium]MDA0956423.1 nitrogen regulation protein NR(II) [Pseudomonadota bacterium]MDA1206261.1 nitrogen regulation protein NR(II) [Pseudomonadota bacterium]
MNQTYQSQNVIERTLMSDTAFDNLTTSVLILDQDLNLLQLNQSAESLFELSEKRALQKRLSSLVPGWRLLEPLLVDALADSRPYTQRQAQIELLSGDFVTVDLTVSPISEASDAALIVEVIALDRYLRIDRDNVHREHQEGTQQMIRGLAHEIKNPLGGIRGSAQLLHEELESPELKEYTSIIIEETDRLKTLVDRLLGPNQPSELRAGNIHEILERARKLIELEAPFTIGMNRDYDPSIPDVWIDTDLMFQALLNILRNAMQSLSKSTNPTIKLVTRTERRFTIASVLHRNVLKIDIIDNGPGIPLELRDNLFLPMITGRPDGTGLGLSVAHAIVHRHGGIIEFNSEPGRTQFSIIIPLEIAPS